MDEQSRIAPQKPNRRSPRAGFSGGRGFRRHLLSRSSVRVEVRDGEVRRLRICGSLGNCYGNTGSGLTEDRKYMAAAGKGERQRRISGDGEAEAEMTVTDAISSPPPSKGVTPMIMWIKWQKISHARSPPAPTPTASATARSAAARACGMPLSFSQLLNLDE